jgi:hypothetical protein
VRRWPELTSDSLAQVCRPGDGFIAGLQAAREMEQLVLGGLGDVEAQSKAEALVYLVR